MATGNLSLLTLTITVALTAQPATARQNPVGDTKVEGGPLGEGSERSYNSVRCVRDE